MMLKQTTKDLDDGDWVYIRYSLDGSKFNHQRLQDHENTLVQVIWDLCVMLGVRPPTNECPVYDTKQSDGEVPVMLELWGI